MEKTKYGSQNLSRLDYSISVFLGVGGKQSNSMSIVLQNKQRNLKHMLRGSSSLYGLLILLRLLYPKHLSHEKARVDALVLLFKVIMDTKTLIMSSWLVRHFLVCNNWTCEFVLMLRIRIKPGATQKHWRDSKISNGKNNEAKKKLVRIGTMKWPMKK